jgi:hypothetical protein
MWRKDNANYFLCSSGPNKELAGGLGLVELYCGTIGTIGSESYHHAIQLNIRRYSTGRLELALIATII